MSRIKVKQLFTLLVSVFYRMQLFILKAPTAKRVVIFDIDNTIAHTWPHLRDGTINYERLPYFKDVYDTVNLVGNENSTLLLYFTVRPWRAYGSTHRWLLKIGLPISLGKLFLFVSPQHKVNLIQWIARKNKNITLFDDMSWGHESGEVQSYDEEVRAIESLGIEYFGFHDLVKIQRQSAIIQL